MTTIAVDGNPMPVTFWADTGSPRMTVLMTATVTKYIPPVLETPAVDPTETLMNVETTPTAAATSANPEFNNTCL